MFRKSVLCYFSVVCPLTDKLTPIEISKQWHCSPAACLTPLFALVNLLWFFLQKRHHVANLGFSLKRGCLNIVHEINLPFRFDKNLIFLPLLYIRFWAKRYGRLIFANWTQTSSFPNKARNSRHRVLVILGMCS